MRLVPRWLPLWAAMALIGVTTPWPAAAQTPMGNPAREAAVPFRAGQRILVAVDGAHQPGTVERVTREDRCTRVDYRWRAGNQRGSGYTYPDCIQPSILFTLAQARQLGLRAGAPAEPAQPMAAAPAAVVNPAPTRAAPIAPSAEPAADLPAADIQALLDAHNRHRAEVGVPPLRWSASIAAGAQAWAQRLAARGALMHDRASGLGENLFMSSEAEPPSVAVESWAHERVECRYKVQPVGNESCVVGHYTQMVWRLSTELGCGTGHHIAGGQVWVCRYSPPGNMIGQRPY